MIDLTTISKTNRHRLLRAARRGVTLFEVLIVLAIMAMIAGGVGFALLPRLQEARIQKAQTDTRNIRQVAMQYVALKGGDCPSVEGLIASKELEAAEGGRDPWGQVYVISCETEDVMVASAGPDKQAGTEDDISAPQAAAGGEG
ncbi:MAG: type II secretion system protein GspG [Polyangiaceae bacterium]